MDFKKRTDIPKVSRAESFVSKVFFTSPIVREAFNMMVDYEKLFVRWLLGPILRSIAVEIHERMDGGALLDLGCGPGNLLFEIHKLNSGIRLIGTDISRSKIRKARKNSLEISSDGMRFLLNKVADLPFEENSFEMVVSTFGFHIWQYPVEMLNEIHRVLRRNGELIIYNFNGSESHRVENFEYFAHSVQKAPSLARKILLREARFGYNPPGYHYYGVEEVDRLIQQSFFKKAEIKTRPILDSGDHFLLEAHVRKT